MDNSQSVPQELPQSAVPTSPNSDSLLIHSDLPAACAVCQKILFPDDEGTGDLEPISMCGDCKFLFLEDLRSPVQDSHRRRPPRVRRTRYSSSESIENLFSQHFSHMINLVRQNQSTISGHEDQLVDADAGARLLQRPSSRTTPSGSRRWRRVLSDTESDGFDNMDSLYGETESNISYGGYRLFNGESDAISFSAYGGDSDASVDGNSFLDVEMFVQPDDGSNLNSDTDIDPMHARLSQWNSDDQEDDDDEEDEDGEWEEADPEENVVASAEAEVHPRNFFPSSSNERNVLVSMSRRIHSPEFLGTAPWRLRAGRQTFISNLDASEVLPYFGNSEDYLDARGFEEYLDHLAETDNSRRGAPPAAVSFVNSLPRVAITEEHEKHDDLVCAICKDVLSIGTEVNQLPCFHLYHPSCIHPWLTARNSCPLCRYELPTDDREYEEGKLNSSSIREIPQQDSSDDSSSDTTDGAEADDTCEISPECRELADDAPVINSTVPEGGRRRWFFLAAAPIVGLVGMALVLWFHNPVTERRGTIGHSNIHGQTQLHGSVLGPSPASASGSGLPNQRENRSRRWWSLF